MSEVGINERVARMVGYQFVADFKSYWINPKGVHSWTIPDFEHSLDACREVLEWIGEQQKRVEFYKALLKILCINQPGTSAWTIWNFLNATSKQLCLAALAVGEKKG